MQQIRWVYIRTRDTLTSSKYGCLHCRNHYGLTGTTPEATCDQKSRVAMGLQWLVCLPFTSDKVNRLKHNLELMYLGSMLLLTRPLLLDFTATVRERKSLVTQLRTRLYAQTW